MMPNLNFQSAACVLMTENLRALSVSAVIYKP